MSNKDDKAALAEISVGLLALVRVLTEAKVIRMEDYNKMLDKMMEIIRKQQNWLFVGQVLVLKIHG